MDCEVGGGEVGEAGPGEMTGWITEETGLSYGLWILF